MRYEVLGVSTLVAIEGSNVEAIDGVIFPFMCPVA